MFKLATAALAVFLLQSHPLEGPFPGYEIKDLKAVKVGNRTIYSTKLRILGGPYSLVLTHHFGAQKLGLDCLIIRNANKLIRHDMEVPVEWQVDDVPADYVPVATFNEWRLDEAKLKALANGIKGMDR